MDERRGQRPPDLPVEQVADRQVAEPVARRTARGRTGTASRPPAADGPGPRPSRRRRAPRARPGPSWPGTRGSRPSSLPQHRHGLSRLASVDDVGVGEPRSTSATKPFVHVVLGPSRARPGAAPSGASNSRRRAPGTSPRSRAASSRRHPRLAAGVLGRHRRRRSAGRAGRPGRRAPRARACGSWNRFRDRLLGPDVQVVEGREPLGPIDTADRLDDRQGAQADRLAAGEHGRPESPALGLGLQALLGLVDVGRVEPEGVVLGDEPARAFRDPPLAEDQATVGPRRGRRRRRPIP